MVLSPWGLDGSPWSRRASRKSGRGGRRRLRREGLEVLQHHHPGLRRNLLDLFHCEIHVGRGAEDVSEVQRRLREGLFEVVPGVWGGSPSGSGGPSGAAGG